MIERSLAVEQAQRMSPLVQEDGRLFVRGPLVVDGLSFVDADQLELLLQRQDLLLVVHPAQHEVPRKERALPI